MNKCECPSCESKDDVETKRVLVKNKDGYKWGEFDYCDEAIIIDRKNGFIVDELSESKRGTE